MTDDVQDDKQAPGSSSEVPAVEATDSATVEGAAPQGSPSAESAKAKEPEKSARAKLVEELTTGAGKSADPEGDEPAGDDEDETADEAETTDDEVGDPATAKAAEPIAGAGAKPTGKQDDPPAALTEEELTAPVDVKAPASTKRRIEQLLDERKKTKGLADYGKALLDLQVKAGFTAEQFGEWTALGIRVNEKPEEMPLRLFAHAKMLSEKMGVPLPVESTPAPGLPEEFDDWLLEQVAEGNISHDAFKAMREKLKPLKSRPVAPKAAAPIPAPIKSSPAPVQTPVAQPASIPPAVLAASDEIDTLDADYAKRYPTDWENIRKIAKAGMSKYKGTDPKLWPDFFKTEVKDAIAKIVKPRPKVPPQTLRPAGATASTAPTEGRAGILAELTGRKKT